MLNVLCPLAVKDNPKYLIKAHTKYACIERVFSSRTDALNYLGELFNNFKVESYVLKEI
jgi:hypothetical protein